MALYSHGALREEVHGLEAPQRLLERLHVESVDARRPRLLLLRVRLAGRVRQGRLAGRARLACIVMALYSYGPI